MGSWWSNISKWIKSVVELGHSDFQHNLCRPSQNFQSDKIQHGRETKMATITKISKTNKVVFFQNYLVNLAEI